MRASSRQCAAATVVLVLGLVFATVACGDDEAEPQSGEGDAVAAMVMTAFETGDRADVEAVYAPDVQMVIDEQMVASDREELVAVMGTALAAGNSYEQIGPVVEYTGADGDLYVATVVVVMGPGHPPEGDPHVGFYRVRDGQVIRHVFIDARAY